MTKKCEMCGQYFEKQKNQSLKYWARRRFCSRKCADKAVPAQFHRDITGQKWNRLTAIRRVQNKGRSICWLFKCDCGNMRKTVVSHVKYGRIKSCGCLQIEAISAKRGKLSQNFVHGMSDSRFYRIWAGVRSRCLNPNRIKYQQYGAKGIKCNWNSFIEFKNDMYDSYVDHVNKFGEKQTQIDRIKNEGHYQKDNCRWVTLVEQARNKRNSKLS